MVKKIIICVVIVIFLNFNFVYGVNRSITLFSASSTTNVVKELGELFQKESGISLRISNASSSLLAKQIESGAPADVFISANTQWMDYLEKKGMIIKQSRFNLFSNSMVLITYIKNSMEIKLNKGFDFINKTDGKIAIANPEHAPAGIYAKESLLYFNWWNGIKNRIVTTSNVRMALMLVENDEAKLGVVYKTDALISKKVKILGTFPQESHKKIIFTVARVDGSSKLSDIFLKFLRSKQAKKIYKKHGFISSIENGK